MIPISSWYLKWKNFFAHIPQYLYIHIFIIWAKKFNSPDQLIVFEVVEKKNFSQVSFWEIWQDISIAVEVVEILKSQLAANVTMSNKCSADFWECSPGVFHSACFRRKKSQTLQWLYEVNLAGSYVYLFLGFWLISFWGFSGFFNSPYFRWQNSQTLQSLYYVNLAGSFVYIFLFLNWFFFGVFRGLHSPCLPWKNSQTRSSLHYLNFAGSFVCIFLVFLTDFFLFGVFSFRGFHSHCLRWKNLRLHSHSVWSQFSRELYISNPFLINLFFWVSTRYFSLGLFQTKANCCLVKNACLRGLTSALMTPCMIESCHTYKFCGHVGLFYGYVGLFYVYAGLFFLFCFDTALYATLMN